MESRQGSIPSDIFKQHQQKQGLFVDFKGMVFKKSPVLHTVEVATCLQDDNQQKDFQFYNQASMCSCLSSTTKPSEPIQPGTPLAAYSEGVCDVSARSHQSSFHHTQRYGGSLCLSATGCGRTSFHGQCGVASIVGLKQKRGERGNGEFYNCICDN